MAINGEPQFPFTEAVSFNVSCKDQDEVDRLWSVLTAQILAAALVLGFVLPREHVRVRRHVGAASRWWYR